jgi:AraC family transcriptional regulator
MLRYLANGRIHWKQRAVCNTRTNWEFYAVLDGRCGPVFRDGGRPALVERTLWVFAPECAHSWADDGRPYERIVLHFATVPYPLNDVVRERGWFACELAAADVARLRAIVAELEPHFVQPRLLSTLIFQGRLMDLAALALARHPAVNTLLVPDLASFKVERALAWCAAHLQRQVSIKQVAEVVHVSPSHLRRLFWQVRRASPKAAIQQLRLDKANELMSRSASTLDVIAGQCGYASASHLCREYKRMHHFTPTHWRKRLVAGYSRPLPAGVAPAREFSAREIERSLSA